MLGVYTPSFIILLSYYFDVFVSPHLMFEIFLNENRVRFLILSESSISMQQFVFFYKKVGQVVFNLL